MINQSSGIEAIAHDTLRKKVGVYTDKGVHNLKLDSLFSKKILGFGRGKA